MRTLCLPLCLASPCLVAVGLAPALAAQDALPTIEKFTDGMSAHHGFVDLYTHPRKAGVWMEVSELDREILYAVSVASGLGSNPIGLDRGSLGPQHVVEFRRRGPKILLVAKNLKFRARSDNPRERAAVRESFAESVLYGFEVVAESDGRVLVDATELLVHDAAGAIDKVKRAGQGTYKLDAKRSAVDWIRAFPDNTEVEVLLTFASDAPGRLVSGTAASGKAFTLRERHSFIELPDGYAPRRADPRVGFFGVSFQDYAAPIDAPTDVRWIARHRLVKTAPAAALARPVEPIVYHVDPGTPEPVRSALKDGARWWADAFRTAGFEDAFRVEDLPADADPLDVRYNMIHWVHRSTRGWSYGSSIRDPRTGEILKGNVLLGSLRVRQDHLIFTGLEGPHDDGCAALAAPDASHLVPVADDAGAARARELALARIRQLSAHEVGHTLGLTHNFAASSYGRASVMDYPAPWVRVKDGALDFSAAYATGVGEYDEWAIRWGYAQFAPGADERAELERIVREGIARGFVYLTDQDARSPATFHPSASLWDNGADPVAELRNTLSVRRIGLRNFGLDNLRPGAPLADLEPVLVPLWLHHRYQLDAALKVIGGVDFRHAVKGDGQPTPVPVRVDKQKEAIGVVLGLLEPEVLTLSDRILNLIPPASTDRPSSSEVFPRHTGGGLDPVAIALTAADPVVGGLLEPHRAARLSGLPDGHDFAALARRLVEQVWTRRRPGSHDAQRIQRAVQALLVDRLMELADDPSARSDVRAIARDALADLRGDVGSRGANDAAERAHVHDHIRRIDAWLQNSQQPTRRTPRTEVPQGSPIGTGK